MTRKLRIAAIILVAIILAGTGSYYFFFYISPPTVAVTSSDCVQTGLQVLNSSSIVTFSVKNIDVEFVLKPAVSLVTLSDCVYSARNVTTLIKCGIMCGGGLGDAYQYAKQLELNLALGKELTNSNYSVTLSTMGATLFSLFLPALNVYVGSQKITWSTIPPSCIQVSPTSTITYGYNCTTQNSILLTFEIPTNDVATSNGTYDILINSTETPLP
ncbi:MAG: hypothetical protein JRN15_13025 [Nitrososphaerota archaeon]|nr:hypothetical protein [Nitrososphaerota archaeon]